MCQWMPSPRPWREVPPPILSERKIEVGELVSSLAKCFISTSLSEVNFSGLWQFSQASRAGRMFLAMMGYSYTPEAIAEPVCQEYIILRGIITANLSRPMWQSSQATLEWTEFCW